MRTFLTHGQLTVALAAMVAVAVALGTPYGAEAASPDQAVDRMALVSMQTSQADSSSVGSPMRIQTEVSYTLASTQEGFLAMFIFEDSSNNAGAQGPAIPVKAGSGKVTLDIEYPPQPRAQALSLLVGMFGQDKRLIGWLATDPIPVASLAGRLEFQLAMEARQKGDGNLAVDHLTRAIEQSPDAGTLYYWRADTLLRLGKFDAAISDFDASLQLTPQHAASLVGRGITWVWKGEWQKGVDDLTEALAVAPDQGMLTAWAHRARGVANAALNRPDEAVADYRAYLDLMPGASDQAQVEQWIAQLSR